MKIKKNIIRRDVISTKVGSKKVLCCAPKPKDSIMRAQYLYSTYFTLHIQYR